MLRVILFVSLLAAPAYGAETLTVKLGQESATVSLVEKPEQVRLRLEGAGETEILGDYFQEFTVNGKDQVLAARDFDGDGCEEVIVRTTLPPHSGRLYVFRIEAGQLRPLPFGSDDALEVSHGGDVEIQGNQIHFEPEDSKAGSRRSVRYTAQGFRSPSR